MKTDRTLPTKDRTGPWESGRSRHAIDARRAFRSMLALGLGIQFMTAATAFAAQTFTVPEKLTDGMANYQLSRTPGKVMAFDGAGNLHVVYWSGEDQTIPATKPNYVYYRLRPPGGAWSPQISIDDSFIGVDKIGGRHPSLAITPDDTVHVVWHDHRQSTTAGQGWIDNLEIYLDSRPAGGSFSATDIRLTNSTSGSLGDNGYTPQIAAEASGRLHVVWYDFNQDINISDIYLLSSDLSGVFTTASPVATAQLTDLSTRGNFPSYSVPDLAIDTAGTRHLVWVAGFAAGADLYYGSVASGSGTAVEQLLATEATDFLDPPKIEVASNGDVWIVYGEDDGTLNPAEDVILLRKRSGQAGFDPPITAVGGAGRQFAPDFVIDNLGLVHLVWVEKVASVTSVRYGVYDPNAGALTREMTVTDGSGPWARPSLALGADGFAYVLYEQDDLLGGDIWFAVNNKSGARDWMAYQ